MSNQPRDVYVTAAIDPAKTVVATNLDCGCPVYAEDLPIRDWRCEHGNYWLAVRCPDCPNNHGNEREVKR